MVRVTIDMFSGRPNPTWTLDEARAREVLRDIQSRPETIAPLDAYPAILGYRGIIVEEDEGGRGRSELGRTLPAAFRLGSGRAQDNGRSFEIAERLVSEMRDAAPAHGARDDGPGYEQMDLRGLVLRTLSESATQNEFAAAPTDAQAYQIMLSEQANARAESGALQELSPDEALAPPDDSLTADFQAAAACWNPAAVIGSDATSWITQAVGSCSAELAAFNPTFWNSGTTRNNNNCYNYATNRRTDTFAQPGRATCAGTSTMACSNVTAGAVSDGALTVPSCAASTQSPRWYMALVIAPGYDYHWYRKASNGYWGHKPGSTAAKNTDNSGNIIYDPQTANRGPYTQFCGYFFAQAGQGIR